MTRCIRDHGREADMRSRYLSGSTLQAIGDDYGISRERVRQILTRLGVRMRPKGRASHSSRPSRSLNLANNTPSARVPNGEHPVCDANDRDHVLRAGRSK